MLGSQVEHLSVVVQQDFVRDAGGRRAIRADALSFVVHVYVAIVVDVITRNTIVTFVQHAKTIAPGHISAGTVDHVFCSMHTYGCRRGRAGARMYLCNSRLQSLPNTSVAISLACWCALPNNSVASASVASTRYPLARGGHDRSADST